MPLTEATLASGLEALTPTDDEATAINALVAAYGTYAAGAQTALTGPILTPAVTAGKVAMASSLVGMSADGAALQLIPSAVRAFWTAAFLVPATAFTGASAITPFTFATLDDDVASAFDTSTSGKKSLADSAAALANALNKSAIGGMVTMTPPPPGVTSPIT